ncbi:MAG TPA: metal ABC transporter substrate-binding protein [Candidatus Eisenbacteria bacterium]|nr:metal ABC transporter substrate-binding protein [Candidatus Eisenbacteria bacterium]
MPEAETVLNQRRPSAAIALLAVVAAVAAACQGGGGTPAPASAGTKLAVVTTTTVFGDLVANVGADFVQVTSLVPRHADVHTFAPKPADVRAVADARLLVMNGLGLDDWLEKTITNASATGTPLIKLGVDLPGVELLPGEEPGTQNPHLFMAVPYAILYVDRIGAALKAADPANATGYDQQAAAYKARLQTLDAKIREEIGTIPAGNRKLVTFHDAFPYFTREYGIELVGVAVNAPGQDPSAGEIADLIQAIRAAKVKAIFSEDQFPTSLVDQIAAQTGAAVVADLYDDALGDPPVDSYVGVMEWDVEQLVKALG